MTSPRDRFRAALAAYEAAVAEVVKLPPGAHDAHAEAVFYCEIEARLALEVARKELKASNEPRRFVVHFKEGIHAFEAGSRAEAVTIALKWMRSHGWDGSAFSLAHLSGEDGTDDYIPDAASPPPLPGLHPDVGPPEPC